MAGAVRGARRVDLREVSAARQHGSGRSGPYSWTVQVVDCAQDLVASPGRAATSVCECSVVAADARRIAMTFDGM